MIDELRALAIFSHAVELGSFRGAAAKLNLSPSVVSHHISRLEKQLGKTLLYRSTRKLSLTDDGKKLFEAAQLMREAAERGLREVTDMSDEPAGNLIITMPAMFANSRLMDSIASFAKRFSRVKLSIVFSDKAQDLVRDGIDMAIRIGALKDSALKCRRLFDMPRTLVASSEVVTSHPRPKSPQDLIDWDWIGVQMRPNSKILTNLTGKEVKLDFKPRITVDSLDAVCRLTLAGLGLSSPPDFMIESDLNAGRLVKVLPDWEIESLGVYAVWPGNATRTSLGHRLIEFLTNEAEGKL